MSTIQDLPASAVPLNPLKPGRIRYSCTWRVPREDVDAFTGVVLYGDVPLQHPFEPGLLATRIYGVSVDRELREMNITVHFAPFREPETSYGPGTDVQG